MYDMELIEANPDPVKSEVMTRASELRSEGYDKSDALSMAWDDVLGEEDYDEDEEEPELELLPQSRRRSNVTADNPLGGGLLLIVGGLYLVWCYFASKYKGLPWSWTPWRQPVARPIKLAEHRVIPPSTDNTREIVQLIVP